MQVAWKFPDGTIGFSILLAPFEEARKILADSWEDDPETRGTEYLGEVNLDATWFGFLDCVRVDPGNKLYVDMSLARAQRLNELRLERDEKLVALDGPWMRETGQGKTIEASKIEATRQALRDFPAKVEQELATIKTPEELEAFEPVWPILGA